MLTVADMGKGGVKNGTKSADVLYGRPLSLQTCHRLHVAVIQAIGRRMRRSHPMSGAPRCMTESVLENYLQRHL